MTHPSDDLVERVAGMIDDALPSFLDTKPLARAIRNLIWDEAIEQAARYVEGAGLNLKLRQSLKMDDAP